MFFPLQLVLSGGCCVIVLVALPAHCRLANITFYLLLATSTPASPCHSKKVSYSSALVVYSPGFCSYTMYSCCCCLCLLLIFRPSGISPVSTFVCTTTFRIPYKLQLLSYSVSFFFLRTAYDVYVLPPPPPLVLVLLLLSLVMVFRKSVSRRRQINTTFLAASLSPIIPTIIQVTSVQP